jgi:hypothetical protein
LSLLLRKYPYLTARIKVVIVTAVFLVLSLASFFYFYCSQSFNSEDQAPPELWIAISSTITVIGFLLTISGAIGGFILIDEQLMKSRARSILKVNPQNIGIFISMDEGYLCQEELHASEGKKFYSLLEDEKIQSTGLGQVIGVAYIMEKLGKFYSRPRFSVAFGATPTDQKKRKVSELLSGDLFLVGGGRKNVFSKEFIGACKNLTTDRNEALEVELYDEGPIENRYVRIYNASAEGITEFKASGTRQSHTGYCLIIIWNHGLYIDGENKIATNPDSVRVDSPSRCILVAGLTGSGTEVGTKWLFDTFIEKESSANHEGYIFILKYTTENYEFRNPFRGISYTIDNGIITQTS